MPRSRFLFLPFALILLGFTHGDGQCPRQSEERNSSATYVCSIRVNVTRLAGCSTHVVESIIFPNSSGIPWQRDLPYLPGQDINGSTVSVNREGRATNFTFDGNNNRITVQSGKNDGPVRFDLNYTIIHGVMRYTGHCNFSNDGGVDDSGDVNETRYNLMFWGVGNNWVEQVDFLTVSFRTDNKSAALRFADAEKNESKESGLEIWRERMDVNSTTGNFFALETGINFCVAEYKCFTEAGRSRGLLLGLVIFFIVLCSLCAIFQFAVG